MNKSRWKAQVLTLFPEMFPGPLGCSITGKALEEGLWSLEAISLRNYATDVHRTVDDTPFGGGPGMILKADVLGRALDELQEKKNHLEKGRLLYLTPRGKPLKQTMVRGLVKAPFVTVLCGRYEGVDQRVIEHYAMEEISVGDYVLSGGELAAYVLLDACIRLLPGVLGDNESAMEESFEDDLLEYPHYTRPQVWKDLEVPPVLRSGHHGMIAAWRKREAERVTQERRPDLWDRYLTMRKGRPFNDKGD